jgi:Putative zinc-finger
MCDERERLIGFVYDECDPGERQEVARHLEGCGDCRREISALRGVRQDLLAWDVPNHESVWRPFVAAPGLPSWRQIPVWLLAAAASVMFAVGAAGGVATHLALSRDPGTPAQAARGASAQTPVPISATDLAALEDRVYARIRETDQRVRLMSAHVAQQSTAQSVSLGPIPADLMQELRYLRELQAAQNKLNFELVSEVGNLTSRTRKIEAIGYASPLADR